MDYTLSGMVGNAFSLLLTKVLYPKARLVRRPFYLRGKSGFVYGEGLTTGHACRFGASNIKQTLFIGKQARIGDYVHINAEESVTIGDNVLIASKVFISDTSHGKYSGELQSSPDTNPSERELQSSPVIIGDNVWIGENVVILAGTRVGNGCIVGANSLLSGKTYPDNTIIIGTPGRIYKQYNPETGKWERVGSKDEL